MRAVVVGHVEWIEFARVDHVPMPGEIVHAQETWCEPGGGGAVAAVQMAKLAGEATFYTALGDDELGRRTLEELEALGLRVEAAWRDEPQRRGFVHIDSAGERTITVIGERLGPSEADDLAWGEIEGADAAYFTAGDASAARRARSARCLVATARALVPLAEAEVELDALVASGSDEGERYEPAMLDPEPRLVVRTAGAAGGAWERPGAVEGRYPATDLPRPARDSYGCGDSFAGGLAYGLGAGMDTPEALDLAARCGAACLTGRGPYEKQLVIGD